MKIDDSQLLSARDDELVDLESGTMLGAHRLVVSLWDENENDLRKPAWGHVTDLCFWAGYRHGPVPPESPRQQVMFP